MKILIILQVLAAGSALRVPRKATSLLSTTAAGKGGAVLVDGIVQMIDTMVSTNIKDQELDDKFYTRQKCTCNDNMAKLKASIGADLDKKEQMQDLQNQLAAMNGQFTGQRDAAATQKAHIGLSLKQADELNDNTIEHYRNYMYQVTKDIASLQACLVILAKFYTKSATLLAKDRKKIRHLLKNMDVKSSFMQAAFAKLAVHDQQYLRSMLFEASSTKSATAPVSCSAKAASCGNLDVETYCSGNLPSTGKCTSSPFPAAMPTECAGVAPGAYMVDSEESTCDSTRGPVPIAGATFGAFDTDPFQSAYFKYGFYGDWCACFAALEALNHTFDATNCWVVASYPEEVSAKAKLCKSHPGSEGSFQNLPGIGKLYGIIESMYLGLVEQKATNKKAEATRYSEYVAERDAMLEVKKAVMIALETAKNQLADTVGAEASVAAQLTSLQGTLSAAETLMIEIETECQTAEAQYVQRKAIRTTENTQLKAAYATLTDFKHRKLFDVTMSFLQIGKTPYNSLSTVTGSAGTSIEGVVTMITRAGGLMDSAKDNFYKQYDNIIWCDAEIKSLQKTFLDENSTATFWAKKKAGATAEKASWVAEGERLVAKYATFKAELEALTADASTFTTANTAELDQIREMKTIISNAASTFSAAFTRNGKAFAIGTENGLSNFAQTSKAPTAAETVGDITKDAGALIGHSDSQAKAMASGAFAQIIKTLDLMTTTLTDQATKYAASMTAAQKTCTDMCTALAGSATCASVYDFSAAAAGSDMATAFTAYGLADSAVVQYSVDMNAALGKATTASNNLATTVGKCQSKMAAWPAVVSAFKAEWNSLYDAAGALAGVVSDFSGTMTLPQKELGTDFETKIADLENVIGPMAAAAI